jgi:hypothetical protein
VNFEIKGHDKLKCIKFASYGKFAAVFMDEGRDLVQIWDNESSGLEMDIEGVINLKYFIIN